MKVILQLEVDIPDASLGVYWLEETLMQAQNMRNKYISMRCQGDDTKEKDSFCLMQFDEIKRIEETIQTIRKIN